LQKVKKYVLYDFPDIDISSLNEEYINILFIHDPYTYFNALLQKYVDQKKSMLFTQDILSNKDKMKSDPFLNWLHTLNFIPFYNPQTFQFDSRKRLSIAIEILEQFDYVVPYVEMEIFLDNVSLDLKPHQERENNFIFDFKEEQLLMKNFINKDIKLYERSMELWELIKKNNYNPLGELIKHNQKLESIEDQRKKLTVHKYKGIAGQITSKSIKGWVFHTENKEHVKVEVYNNSKLLCTLTADGTREDLKKRQLHPTGKCGFEITFKDTTFTEGDNLVIKVLPQKINLPLGPDIRSFLKISD